MYEREQAKIEIFTQGVIEFLEPRVLSKTMAPKPLSQLGDLTLMQCTYSARLRSGNQRIRKQQ